MRNDNQQDWNSIILDSIADGIFTIDCDQNITYFNRAAEKITGVSREEALGKKCFFILRADSTQCQSNCFLKESMRTGQEKISRKINILRRDGKQIPVTISTSVVRDDSGAIIDGVETLRDISVIELLRKKIKGSYGIADFITKNHEIKKIFDILPDIAKSNSTVLIEGPSGTGKELIAKAIHDLSERDGKFVALNCTALPDTLLESELFGYQKGAFTDAKRDKLGRFSLAEGGTLFLDEIGDISGTLQVKLLRAIEKMEFEPLGSTETVKANVRIVAATNKRLADLVYRKEFRDDLFYRLNVVMIRLPPLFKRREDIPLLIEHFIHKFNALKGKFIEDVSPEVLNFLMQYDFPGNVRELENFIEYAFILCRGTIIGIDHLPKDVLGERSREQEPRERSPGKPLAVSEEEATLQALIQHGWNRNATAAYLRINPSTLWRKMKKFGLHPPLVPSVPR
jgi:PAS domain S-box-containing protein